MRRRVLGAFRALLEALAGRNARVVKARQSFASLSGRMTVILAVQPVRAVGLVNVLELGVAEMQYS